MKILPRRIPILLLLALPGLAVSAELLADILARSMRGLPGTALVADVPTGRLLAAQIKAGWWERAGETAGRLRSPDPLRDIVHGTVMRLRPEQRVRDAALRRSHDCVG